MEVLTKILHQGTGFDTLNETVLADRYLTLIKLVTMITDDSELPVVNALASVLQTNTQLVSFTVFFIRLDSLSSAQSRVKLIFHI